LAPAEAPREEPVRLRPSIQSAGGLDILRALPTTQTPAERPAVSASPLPRPSRDRPTAEVLQELADAITRAARSSGAVPALDAPPVGAPRRATAPRKAPVEGAVGEVVSRTPAGGSPAVRATLPRAEPSARRESQPVTFTPSPAAVTQRPAAPEPLAPRESAEVTFTPAAEAPSPAEAVPSPLEAAFAPKPALVEPEPERLPESLRVSHAAASGAAAVAQRPSRAAPRRTFGGGLPAEPEPATSLVRLPYVLGLLIALAGAVWWFAIRPRTELAPSVGAGEIATAPADSVPPPVGITPAESTSAPAPAVTSRTDSAPVAPTVNVPDVLTPLDELVDSLDAVIFKYHDRAAVFDGGERDCQALAAALVSVDRLWIAYNNRRRQLDTPLDSLRSLRDEAAYANVEAVDRHFNRSGCPRP
jgi:hypothetical protein